MKVILAGYSKTGTKTLAAAFSMLGYKTYDYMENFFYLRNDWIKIFNGEASNDDIRKIFHGVDALTDTPTFLHWEKLCEAFPEAKIVLTLRDEESWYKGMIHQVEVQNDNFFVRAMNICLLPGTAIRTYMEHTASFVGKVCKWPSAKIVTFHKEDLLNNYRRHNEAVLKNAPKEKLLVYRVSDGWKPLCEFLKVKVPDQPFPHKNKKGSIVDENVKNWFAVPLVLLCSVGAAVLGYVLFKWLLITE